MRLRKPLHLPKPDFARCAVHLPDGVLPSGLVAPEEVIGAVVIEISGADNLPVGVGDGREIVAAV